MKKIDAWHFVAQDRILANGSGLLVEPGYIYSEPAGDLVMCQRGMHASRDPFDILTYAPGPWLCRVRCWGGVQEQEDKLVCRHREVVAMKDISRELRLFGCWCVRETPLVDGRKVWDLLTDGRSRTAVEIAERHVRGEATDIELAAAEAAARTAAEAAARTAARTAAEAARTAAEAAAWTAAEAAETDWAAWAVARDAQRSEFGRCIADIFDKRRAAEGGAL